jgi:hypothetical protein
LNYDKVTGSYGFSSFDINVLPQEYAMNKLVLFFFLSFSICNFSLAEVRYVSHSGSNTPPYLTWETAADSIMSAINISSFGDTIYVANGVYEEQVVMIPGLSLIGAGMDSCIIDAGNILSNAIINDDTCLIEGFQVICSTYSWCIYDSGSIDSKVISNHFKCLVQTGGGIDVLNLDTSINSNIYVYKNLINDVTIGIHILNSNCTIRENSIYPFPDPQASIITGILIGADFFNFYPVIDSNYIETERTGIDKGFGARPIISNNSIILRGVGGLGMSLGGPSDTAWVYNNLVYAERGMEGIYPSGIEHLYLYNNYFIGNFDDQQNLKYVVTLGPGQTAINNVITNAERGVRAVGTQDLVFKYNNVWNNDVNYYGFTPDSTNLSVDPMVMNEDTSRGELDFHLQMFSPLIDKGDPAILDKDSTRSDIGLYGGPFGQMYNYQDLPPRPPVNLSAIVDTDYILLKWNKNTEADFSHYNLYRDTTENFTADSTTFVVSVEDTFYIYIRSEGISDLYFKLTAEDNQGNISEPSEELHLVLTGIKNNEEFTISSYKLFQNYPNPFNPSTRIGYRLKERGYVKLYVYDIKGELIEILVNKHQEGGYHEVSFGREKELASGIYIYQIMVRSGKNIPVFTDIKKMIYIK